MTGSPVAIAAAVVLSAGLVLGCGSDGNTGSTSDRGFTLKAGTTVTTGPVTKGQFIDRVNEICRRAWPILLENFEKYSSWQDPGMSDRRLFAESVLYSFLSGLDFYVFDDIYALAAPEGEKAEVEDVIGKMQIGVELGQRRLRIRTVSQLNLLFSDYNRAALGYGLDKDCLVDGAKLKLVKATA